MCYRCAAKTLYRSLSRQLWFLLLLSRHLATGLTCNSCNIADIFEDCYINQKVCRNDYVCFVETQSYTFTRSDNSRTKMKVYSMGCRHFDLCRDRTTHGPGAYGYATSTFKCCCTDHCIEPDGVGLQKYEHCRTLWKNNTISSGGSPGPYVMQTQILVLVMLSSYVQHLRLFSNNGSWS